MASVEYLVSENDIKSSVVRLTQVQDFIPATAYSNEGPSPDPYNPPAGLTSVKINWGGQASRHFISKPHGHAPKPRNDAVQRFFLKNQIVAGSELIIEIPRSGEISIYPKK